MNLSTLITPVKSFVHSNSSSILLGAGIAGIASTAYLAARGGYEARIRLEESDAETLGHKIEDTWDVYLPAAITGTISVGFIVAATRINARKAAAAYSLLATTERVFSEYKDKVTETIGEKKERAIRDEIAQDRVNNSPPGTVIFGGDSEVLCCEMFTGRYFKCDSETLKKAQNDINSRIIDSLYVTLDEFYDMVGLPQTSNSHKHGWDSDKLMDLDISATMSPEGKPCLSFDYNYIKLV